MNKGGQWYSSNVINKNYIFNLNILQNRCGDEKSNRTIDWFKLDHAQLEIWIKKNMIRTLCLQTMIGYMAVGGHIDDGSRKLGK